METLAYQIKSNLPEGMHLPPALETLFDWIEENEYTWTRDGLRGGSLMTYGNDTTALAPFIAFSATGSKYLKYWFGQDVKALHDRVFVFSKTGSDGSMGAFWLDDNGKQHIVHMGSGSGSVMTCVLTDNAVDFLRLLAIGYDEICWGGFDAPPADDTPLNMKFRNWVETTFSTTIPELGNEIVKETAGMDDEEPISDPFLNWVRTMNA